MYSSLYLDIDRLVLSRVWSEVLSAKKPGSARYQGRPRTKTRPRPSASYVPEATRSVPAGRAAHNRKEVALARLAGRANVALRRFPMHEIKDTARALVRISYDGLVH